MTLLGLRASAAGWGQALALRPPPGGRSPLLLAGSRANEGQRGAGSSHTSPGSAAWSCLAGLSGREKR